MESYKKKSNKSSCVFPKEKDIPSYCELKIINGINIPLDSKRIIKTLYEYEEGKGSSKTSHKIEQIGGKITYEAEIKAANILVKIDATQEYFLYPLGGCTVTLASNEDVVNSLHDKCKYGNIKEKPKFVYLLEMQNGGQNLFQLRDENLKYSEAQSRELLDKIYALLDILHANKITHGDYNPGNIVLDKETNTVKLIDFATLEIHTDENEFKNKQEIDIVGLKHILECIGLITEDSNYKKALIKVSNSRILKKISIDDIKEHINTEEENFRDRQTNKRRPTSPKYGETTPAVKLTAEEEEELNKLFGNAGTPTGSPTRSPRAEGGPSGTSGFDSPHPPSVKKSRRGGRKK